MTTSQEQITASLLSALMVLSVVAIGGTGLVGSATAADHLETSSIETKIDPVLQEANGTQEVYITFDQYDGTLAGDRDQKIARLKEHAETTQSTARYELNSLSGVELINTYWITNTIRAEVDTTTVTTNELATIEGVRSITVVPEYSIPESTDKANTTANSDEVTYGLDQINATETWYDFDATGEDVKVAVLDTGVDVNHSDLDLYTEDENDPTYPGGWVEIGPDGEPVEGSEPHDTDTHGTHVSGTIGADIPEENNTPAYGVAPNVNLQHALVLPGGSGGESDPLAGFEYVVEEMDTDVASMSFGAGCGLTGPVYEDAWIPAIQNANEAGVVAVTAAGNSGESCVGSPGNIYNGFGIGASDEAGNIADFSSGDTIEADNWDESDPEWPEQWVKPDVAAPGDEVFSSVPGDKYDTYQGTSMATPHVSGAIALMLSVNEDLSAEEIQDTLEETAWKPEGEPEEKDTRYGYGIIDVHASVEEIGGAALQYELGDVDKDESITVQDVQLTQQYIYDMEPEPFNEDLADLNRDGEVTISDLNLLQQKVQGTLSEGKINVTDLNVPNDVEKGEQLPVTVDLENPGEEGAVQKITLYVNEGSDKIGEGEPVATEVVDMAGSTVDNPKDKPSEATISFEVATDDFEGGDFTVSISTEDDQESSEFTYLASHFDVSNFPGPEEVNQGETLTVDATIENTGNVEDTQSVEYRLGDLNETALTESVTLSPGEVTTVSFAVETDNISGGTYEQGVFTNDDSVTNEISVLEANFDVEITDAPTELTPGGSYTVAAELTNTGNAPDTQSITYDVMQAGTDVAVVDSAGDSAALQRERTERDVESSEFEALNATGLAETLEGELSSKYNVHALEAEQLLESTDEYDVFVVNDFGDEDVEAFLEEVSDDQSVIFLENWGDGSSAISDRSEVTDNPTTVKTAYTGSLPVELEVTDDHELFNGVAAEGETVALHNGELADRAWFNGYDGTTIADVGSNSAISDGAAVGVDEDRDHVLLSSFGRTPYVSEDDFTNEANTILANAVKYVDESSIASSQVTQSTTTSVSLEPGESSTVEFTTALDDLDPQIDWEHVVKSEDDEAREPFLLNTQTGTVTGTVSDEVTSEPVANATIELVNDGETYTAVTSTDGTYAIEGVLPGTYNLTANADEYSEETTTVTVSANETVTMDIAFAPPTGTISGTVIASDNGEPVANATVVGENSDGEVYEATTDENGTYSLTDISSGSYVVNIADAPPGYEIEEIVTVEPEEHVDGVDLELDRTDGSINGYVTSAAGIPIADATVLDADQDAFKVTTNEDGYYQIDGVTPGTTALRATADGYDDSNIEFIDVNPASMTTANLTLGTYFEVINLEGPETATQGETITVNATVTNTGEKEDTRTVFYFPPGTDFGSDIVDYQPEMSQTVSLDGSESTTVEFEYDIPESDDPGEYKHGISADEVASTTITIEESEDSEPEPAFFEVTDLKAPETAAPGEEITVNATISNTGDESDQQDIYLFWDTATMDLDNRSNGEYRERTDTESITSVSLDGGESKVVSLTQEISTDTELGEYHFSVSTLQDLADGSLTVNESDEASILLASDPTSERQSSLGILV